MPMFVAAQELRVLNHLMAFVRHSCGDPVFRRQLRYRPAEALAASGLGFEGVPETLPIRHYEVSVDFQPDVLFGPSVCTAAPGRSSLPLELRLVRYGLKPLALVAGPADEIFETARAARALGLPVLMSHDEFTPVGDDRSNGYVHRAEGRRPAQAGSPGWRRLLAGRDWRQVELGWLSLLFGWDEFLGRLLGYPRCCVAAFSAHWEEACRDHSGEVATVLLKNATQESGGHRGLVRAAHFGMNLFGRYFGDHLIEHFPCGLGCQATARLAEQTMRTLRDFEPEVAEELEGALRVPVLFVPGEGAFLMRGASWEAGGRQFRYNAQGVVASNPQSFLGEKLRGHDSLVVSHGGVTLGGEPVDGWLVDFPAETGPEASRSD